MRGVAPIFSVTTWRPRLTISHCCPSKWKASWRVGPLRAVIERQPSSRSLPRKAPMKPPYEPMAGRSNKCWRLAFMELFVGGNTPDLSRGCNPVNTPATVRYSSGANVLLAVGKTYFQKADPRAAKSQRRSDVRREDRTCQWESKPWESKPWESKPWESKPAIPG